MHMLGMYFAYAIDSTVCNSFLWRKKGEKAHAYPKEPIMQRIFENEGLTEEEIQEKEIRKAIMVEKQYMAKAANANLPETLIL